MFDATKLLQQLLGPQAAATAQGYIDQGQKAVEGLVGPDALAKGKDLLGQGLSSLEATATQYVGADKVAQAKTLVKENQLATGAALGGLLGLLVGTESGRKAAGTAVKVGTVAALGGLAWKAWQNWQAQGATSAPAEAPAPLDPATEQKAAADTIVAMIQAAKADGHLDDAERARIMSRVGDLDGPAKAFLDTELAAPVDVDRVASLATDEPSAVRLYAASLLAMDPDQAIERAYLAALAQKLGLSADLCTEIERGVKSA